MPLGEFLSAQEATEELFDDEEFSLPGKGLRVRTTARTTARTSARRKPKQIKPAKYVVRFTNGKTHEAVDYHEERSDYVFNYVGGTSVTIPKTKVESIDPLLTRPLFVDVLDPLPNALPTQAQVATVMDGDTIRLQDDTRVRFIGVDTPDTVHPSKPVQEFGKEASAFTREGLEGEAVYLLYDQANAAVDHRDRFGRLMAYVVRTRDDLEFNVEIIRQGYGHAYTKYPFDRMEAFRVAEREARMQQRGLWGIAIRSDAMAGS